ncbi:Uncharacterised protein [Vibrio cholerae]|nr:Uncharacterised protein [Vibrio cholerae]CSC33349.1 Uncharacterised protein [Vibrio cholerae]CSC65427.1 Uncharacterised protein [Vibrio cholerae]CSI49447.1 Uncharacterised protein [Vibrio cholerae]
MIKPKVRTQATKRRSSFSLAKTLRSGGIKMGINAMWTGMTFCEAIAISSKEMSTRYFNPVDAAWLSWP